jgi:prepilin-type N-terminal cleavage/methylation domain-containing protein
MQSRLRSRRGFTLVELLTVIAIIAILAAIIFPVFSVVRRNVHRTQCMSNLHSLVQAIKIYRDDYRVYPEALYGYGYATGGGRTFLFPQYIKDKSGFRCPINPQRTDSTLLMPGIHGITGQPMTDPATNVQLTYFAWDSYDGTVVPHNSPNGQYIVHYMRKFTPGPPSAADEPRQLLYRNPPDNTVVTWCTYHRGYRGSPPQPEPGTMDLVLFLDGRVKTVPANLTATDLAAHLVQPPS